MKPLLLFLLLLSSLAYGQADSTKMRLPSQMIVEQGTTPATDVLGGKYETLDGSAYYGAPVNPLQKELDRQKQVNDSLMNSHALRWTALILVVLASLLAGAK